MSEIYEQKEKVSPEINLNVKKKYSQSIYIYLFEHSYNRVIAVCLQ
jgi:hypothetical protein